MATENTQTTAVKEESNEHDYAEAGNLTSTVASSSSSGTPAAAGGVITQRSFTAPAEPGQSLSGQQPLSVELPDPAVGAEVDCPGGNDVPQTYEDPQRTAASDHAIAAPSGVPPAGRRRTKRPEDKTCSCCKYEFERQGRSFFRRAVFTFTTPETVQWAFPDATVHDKSFLCETCAQVIRSKCKRKQTGKRSLWLKPTPIKQTEVKDKKKKDRRMGKKSKAALLVSKSCYKSALKVLWSAKGARRPMMEFWSKQLKEEMKALTRLQDSPFHQKVSSRKPLSSFPWRRCLSWAQEHAPLVTTCLTSLFPDIPTLSRSSHQVSEEQAQMLLERRAVTALSIPLFTRNIWKNNFLQAALGAELRLQGCSGAALDALNTMGLCQNKDTVRLLVQRIQNSGLLSPNGRQSMMIKLEHLKGEEMSDVEEVEEVIEEDEEEEEVEEEEDEDDDDDDDDDEEEMEMAVAEQEVVEEVQVELEDEDQVAAAEMEKKRRRKRLKKQRKEEKRKEEKRKEILKEGDDEVQEVQEVEEVVEEDDDDEEEGSEQKKRRVVVVRLGLLKGHSEVGRSDLSAP